MFVYGSTIFSCNESYDLSYNISLFQSFYLFHHTWLRFLSPCLMSDFVVLAKWHHGESCCWILLNIPCKAVTPEITLSEIMQSVKIKRLNLMGAVLKSEFRAWCLSEDRSGLFKTSELGLSGASPWRSPWVSYRNTRWSRELISSIRHCCPPRRSHCGRPPALRTPRTQGIADG